MKTVGDHHDEDFGIWLGQTIEDNINWCVEETLDNSASDSYRKNPVDICKPIVRWLQCVKMKEFVTLICLHRWNVLSQHCSMK